MKNIFALHFPFLRFHHFAKTSLRPNLTRQLSFEKIGETDCCESRTNSITQFFPSTVDGKRAKCNVQPWLILTRKQTGNYRAELEVDPLPLLVMVKQAGSVILKGQISWVLWTTWIFCTCQSCPVIPKQISSLTLVGVSQTNLQTLWVTRPQKYSPLVPLKAW